jgi:hypothetical protein
VAFPPPVFLLVFPDATVGSPGTILHFEVLVPRDFLRVMRSKIREPVEQVKKKQRHHHHAYLLGKKIILMDRQNKNL